VAGTEPILTCSGFLFCGTAQNGPLTVFVRHTGQFRERRRASEAQGWRKWLSYLKSRLAQQRLKTFDL
jgi:hypothetical protein